MLPFFASSLGFPGSLPETHHYEWYVDGVLFSRFISDNGRNGHLKSVEAFVPSRFIDKAALMTTSCFDAVTHTERRFQFRLINRRSQPHVRMFWIVPVLIGPV